MSRRLNNIFKWRRNEYEIYNKWISNKYLIKIIYYNNVITSCEINNTIIILIYLKLIIKYSYD